MVNHVGTTNVTLNSNLGDTTSFSYSGNVAVIAGELSKGMLLFDPNRYIRCYIIICEW